MRLLRVRRWHIQLLRFSFVGVLATLVHVTVAFFLLKALDFPLVFANIGAFFTAFIVSYFGNALWSFEIHSEMRSLMKFCVASAVNLSIIVLISSWTAQAGLPPYTGILAVALVIPLVGFLLQKMWVFNR